MPIEHTTGATTITGDSLDYFRLLQYRGAVRLERVGIKMRRGPVVWKQAAREYGITGNREAVYAWLCAKVEEMRQLQEHVIDGKRYVGGTEVQ